jgi:hypothetical protein
METDGVGAATSSDPQISPMTQISGSCRITGRCEKQIPQKAGQGPLHHERGGAGLAARQPGQSDCRALFLAGAFTRYLKHLDPLTRFHTRIDREIRKLLAHRSGGAIKWRVLYPTRDSPDSLDTMMDKMLGKILEE